MTDKPYRGKDNPNNPHTEKGRGGTMHFMPRKNPRTGVWYERRLVDEAGNPINRKDRSRIPNQIATLRMTPENG
jgi:hypothetical protein